MAATSEFNVCTMPGTTCLFVAIPLDCTGQVIDIRDGTVQDITSEKFYDEKLTAVVGSCEIAQINFDAVVSDDTTLSVCGDSDTIIKGDHKGYTGDWQLGGLRSTALAHVMGVSTMALDPTTGEPLGYLPNESFASCSCSPGCGSNRAFAFLVWRSLYAGVGKPPVPATNSSGEKLWEVQVYPYLTAAPPSIAKRSRAQSLQDSLDTSVTVTADRNTGTDFSGLVWPNGKPVFPDAVQVDGTPFNWSNIGSGATLYTTVGPIVPELGCDSGCSHWYSPPTYAPPVLKQLSKAEQAEAIAEAPV